MNWRAQPKRHQNVTQEQIVAQQKLVSKLELLLFQVWKNTFILNNELNFYEGGRVVDYKENKK